MNFDRVAPHYRWLETVTFGSALEKSRNYWIRRVPRPKRALIVGEGNGRFLSCHRATREQTPGRFEALLGIGRIRADGDGKFSMENDSNRNLRTLGWRRFTRWRACVFKLINHCERQSRDLVKGLPLRIG